jgi:hypothetical protein
MTSALAIAFLQYVGPDKRYARGKSLTSGRSSDFGYLASCDGYCDDAEDFLLEVLGGES